MEQSVFDSNKFFMSGKALLMKNEDGTCYISHGVGIQFSGPKPILDAEDSQPINVNQWLRLFFSAYMRSDFVEFNLDDLGNKQLLNGVDLYITFCTLIEGEHLAEPLKLNATIHKELAAYYGLSEYHFNKFVKGKLNGILKNNPFYPDLEEKYDVADVEYDVE